MKLLSSKPISFASLIFAGSVSAEIIDNTVITDFVDQSPGFFVTRPLGVTITGDSAVYLVGTMNFDTEVLNSSFIEANMGDSSLARGYVAGFGNGFGGTSIVIADNGPAGTVPDEIFVEGVPVQLAIKFDQTTGDITLWVNPDLGTTEDLNTIDATANRAIVNGSSFDGVVFRAGDFAAPVSVVDFTDFAVYYNGDTPFGSLVESGPPEIVSFSYDSATGSGEVVISGAANSSYVLSRADDLDFENPDESPITLTAATVGTLNGSEVTTDENGNATVQFNLGTSDPVAFLRAEVAPE